MDMSMENRSLLKILIIIVNINTFVFLLKALVEMANQNSGQIICPKTKELFWLKQAEKVYVM